LKCNIYELDRVVGEISDNGGQISWSPDSPLLRSMVSRTLGFSGRSIPPSNATEFVRLLPRFYRSSYLRAVAVRDGVLESKGHSRRIPRGTKLASALRDYFARQAKGVAAQAKEMLGAMTDGLLECGGEGVTMGPCPNGEKPIRDKAPIYGVGLAESRQGHSRRIPESRLEQQRSNILREIQDSPSLTEDQGSNSFVLASEWDDDLALSAKPHIELYYQKEAAAVKARVGASADFWEVVNPKLSEAVDELSLKFARSTNETTSMELSAALDTLREELRQGLLEGDPVRLLTERVMGVFDRADKSRAITIAATEASRATHHAQVLAGEASGVVMGYRWLLSDDACEVCIAIAEANPEIEPGGTFAKFGSNPEYSDVQFPPAHPSCQCSITEILDNEPRPESGELLHLPYDLEDE
jgi:hypothetical protein